MAVERLFRCLAIIMPESNMETGYQVDKERLLQFHGVDIAQAADDYGTPLFLYDEESIRNNYRNFAKAFSTTFGNVTIYYSIKTNYLPAICRILAEEGAKAEVASGLDMYASTVSGFLLKDASFDGLYKSEQDLRTAVEKGISLINVESLDELHLLDRLAGLFGKRQEIGLRLNPQSASQGFLQRLLDPEWILDYPTLRFGFLPDEAAVICKHIEDFKNLRLTSLMIHPYYSDLRTAVRFAAQMRKEHGVLFDKFNFGGGFRSGTLRDVAMREIVSQAIRAKLHLETKDSEHSAAGMEITAHKLYNEIRLLMKEFGVEFSSFCFEPGRYLVGDAGYVLLRVAFTKKTKQGAWIIVDGGTNVLFGGFMERRRIVLANRKSEGRPQKTDIAGPLLYRNDILALRQSLPPLKAGDLIAVLDSGAYNWTRSTQFMFERPPVLLIRQDGRKELIRAKETYQEILGRSDVSDLQ